ncbi:TPA_asm: UL24 uORF 1 RNA *1 [Human alphaherpesvirus 1]|nr:TPA_asm: UL24 uORF 1 RNA *1 [Human alphaherpesvirus 1]
MPIVIWALVITTAASPADISPWSRRCCVV